MSLDWIKKAGSALKDIISKPIEVLCDWGREPLEGRRHERSMESESIKNKHDILMQESKIKTESEARIAENESDVKLEIYRVEQINKSIAQIDEWKKDKEFERMRLTTEAIISYQEKLTKLNVAAINAIGHMQLELRERAQNLVYEKTLQYKKLQDSAIHEAMADLEKISATFANNEIAQGILTRAVDKKLANVIDTAQNFLLELNRDIIVLNNGIGVLSEKGQSFIENHLNKYIVNEQVLIGKSNSEKIVN